MESRSTRDSASVSSLMLCCPLLPSSTRLPCRSSPWSSPCPKTSTATSPEARREGGEWDESGERRDTTLTHCPRPLSPLPFHSPCSRIVSMSVLSPSEGTTSDEEPLGCVRGCQTADASVVDGCICSMMGHRTDAPVELRLLKGSGWNRRSSWSPVSKDRSRSLVQRNGCKWVNMNKVSKAEG